jgi:LysR family nitrogen assimilation transcriptional regulator
MEGQPPMELRTLSTFVRVAELGSFSRAAIEMQIAQPALSRQVRRLEEELGVSLLYRNGRGVSPTHAGELLLASARGILAEVDAAVREVRETRGVMAGSAVIGLPPTVGRVLSIPLARQVRDRFPGVSLKIMEGFSGHLLEWLSNGRVDVAVLYAEPTVPTLLAEPLVDEDLMLIGRADMMPPLRDGTVDLAALRGLALVVPSRPHTLRRHIDHTAAVASVPLGIVLEVDALYSMIETVRQGLALTILPECAARRDLDEGVLVAARIENPRMTRTLYVATAGQRSAAVATRRLAQLVRDEVMALKRSGLWRAHEPHAA